MSAELKKTLEQLTGELGEKKGNVYHATFSVKDVLEKMGRPNTEREQNYVRYIVAQWYAPSYVAPGQGDNGGFIHMRIRSR
jgi:hypothetical protein